MGKGEGRGLGGFSRAPSSLLNDAVHNLSDVPASEGKGEKFAGQEKEGHAGRLTTPLVSGNTFRSGWVTN